jgi:hypothetical protein
LAVEQKGEGAWGVVCFYKWQDGDGLLVGRVQWVTTEDVSFALVDHTGDADSEVVVPLSSIYRITDSPDYVERLRLFAQLNPPIEKANGQITRSQKLIRSRLRTAALTGECVDLTLLSEESRECKVLRVDPKWCEVELYADDPLLPFDVVLTRYDQIVRMRWRSSVELSVTALWMQALSR